VSLRNPSFVLAALLAAGLLGCASTEQRPTGAASAGSAASGPPAAPAAAAPTPAPQIVAAPFPDAVARGAGRLFEDAAKRLGPEPRLLIIDPLIDASSGQQTVATSEMGRWLAHAVERVHPEWRVRDFNRTTLAAAPLLLIGTLTAINTQPGSAEPADAFRICLRLVDLKTGRIVAKGLDRATADSVNAEPLPVFRDAPT
jgi:hypothetical protein